MRLEEADGFMGSSHDSQTQQFIEQHNELAAALLNIKVNERIQVMFNVNDPIFLRARELDQDECEEIEEWSRCGCCGDSTKKLKPCNFCGQLACPTDLNHQRPYPIDNQNK